jgi:hypothetical protein
MKTRLERGKLRKNRINSGVPDKFAAEFRPLYTVPIGKFKKYYTFLTDIVRIPPGLYDLRRIATGGQGEACGTSQVVPGMPEPGTQLGRRVLSMQKAGAAGACRGRPRVRRG